MSLEVERKGLCILLVVMKVLIGCGSREMEECMFYSATIGRPKALALGKSTTFSDPIDL